MAEPTVIQIMEDGRAQPQHSPFDPVTSEIEEEVETPPSQPQKPLNGSVATEILEDHRQQLARTRGRSPRTRASRGIDLTSFLFIT